MKAYNFQYYFKTIVIEPQSFFIDYLFHKFVPFSVTVYAFFSRLWTAVLKGPDNMRDTSTNTKY